MTGNAPQVVYYAMGVLLVLSSLLATRLPLGKALRMGLAWAGIFAGFFILFAFRGEFQDFGQRLKAEALGTPATEGGELRIGPLANMPVVSGRDPLWTNAVSPGPAYDDARLTPRTSSLDADLETAIELPEDNYWAVATSVTLLVAFGALLVRWYWVFGIALAATLLGSARWMWPLQAKVAETEV